MQKISRNEILTFCTWAHEKKIPAAKIGKKWLYKKFSEIIQKVQGK
jgi:hypothetical protein